MLVYDLSNQHRNLESFEVRVRKQERCPNELGISQMIYRKFIKNMWGARYESSLMQNLVSLNSNIHNLLLKLSNHFTVDERYVLVKQSLNGWNKDRNLLSLLENI